MASAGLAARASHHHHHHPAIYLQRPLTFPYFCCSSTPPKRPLPPSRKDVIRPEISPSVLRSLQSNNSSNAPDNNLNTRDGDSLIERNLRKRAAEKKLPPSRIEDNVAFSSPSGIHEFNGSPSEVERYDELSTTCPITSVFWEEKPQGLSLEGFYSLDFHAKSYRLALLSALLLESDFATSASGSSVLWFILSSDIYESMLVAWNDYFPDRNDIQELISNWKKRVAQDLGSWINDKDVIQHATESFSDVWDPQYWSSKIASGKALLLVTTLMLSTEIEILSGTSESDAAAINMKRRLENSSAALRGSLMQLHGAPLDPTDIWEKALKDTSFIFSGDAFLYDSALILPCRVVLPNGKQGLDNSLKKVQDCIDNNEMYSDFIAMLRSSSDNQDQFYLLIAPWYWVMPFYVDQLTPLSVLLLFASCLATSQFPTAGLDYGFSWEPYAVPFCWSAIWSSIYMVNRKQPLMVFPFWNLGAVAKAPFAPYVLPTREAHINVLAEMACSPIVVSFVFLAFGAALWGPSLYNSVSVVDLHGYVLVPPGLFSYSAIFTKLLQTVSVTSVNVEDEGLRLVVSPFALGGLLGLNFTAFNIFPGPQTDGAHMLKNLLGNATLTNYIIVGLTAMLMISLFSYNPFLGLSWVAFSALSGSVVFVKDDVSEPDFLTRAAGFTLIAVSVACLIPSPL